MPWLRANLALFITFLNSSLTGTGGAPAKSLSGSIGCVGNRQGFTHFGDWLNESRRDDDDGDPFGDCFGEEPLLTGDAIEMFVERNSTNNVNNNTNCCSLKSSVNKKLENIKI